VAILPTQAHYIPNSTTHGNYLNILNVTHDLEMQCCSYSSRSKINISFPAEYIYISQRKKKIKPMENKVRSRIDRLAEKYGLKLSWKS
jgi:hypothetical protein